MWFSPIQFFSTLSILFYFRLLLWNCCIHCHYHFTIVVISSLMRHFSCRFLFKLIVTVYKTNLFHCIERQSLFWWYLHIWYIRVFCLMLMCSYIFYKMCWSHFILFSYHVFIVWCWFWWFFFLSFGSNKIQYLSYWFYVITLLFLIYYIVLSQELNFTKFNNGRKKTSSSWNAAVVQWNRKRKRMKNEEMTSDENRWRKYQQNINNKKLHINSHN